MSGPNHGLSSRGQNRKWLCALAVASLAVTACAPEDDAQDGYAEQGLDSTPTPITVKGTGCGKGSVTQTVNSGVATVTFRAFNADLSAGKAVAAKDCTLVIKVPASKGRQYALKNLQITGTLRMDQGVNGRLSVDYWIQGDPPSRVYKEWNYEDPKTRTIGETFAAPNLLTPCGVARSLDVTLRFRLASGTIKRTGSFTISEARSITIAPQGC